MSKRGRNYGYGVLHDLVRTGTLVIDQENHKFVFTDSSAPLRLTGVGNTGPRQNFADRFAGLDDEEFTREAEQCIWLAAYAANNPNSDYHWQADVCYHESHRRGNPELYERAWHQASGQA